jgi:hypothetical protein
LHCLDDRPIQQKKLDLQAFVQSKAGPQSSSSYRIPRRQGDLQFGKVHLLNPPLITLEKRISVTDDRPQISVA